MLTTSQKANTFHLQPDGYKWVQNPWLWSCAVYFRSQRSALLFVEVVFKHVVQNFIFVGNGFHVISGIFSALLLITWSDDGTADCMAAVSGYPPLSLWPFYPSAVKGWWGIVVSLTGGRAAWMFVNAEWGNILAHLLTTIHVFESRWPRP